MTATFADAIAIAVINGYPSVDQALYEALSLHNLSESSQWLRVYEV